MTSSVHELAEEVLDLPPQDRAKILELLINSFEQKPQTQQTWFSLALKRRDEVRTGAVAMVAGQDAVQRIRAQLS